MTSRFWLALAATFLGLACGGSQGKWAPRTPPERTGQPDAAASDTLAPDSTNAPLLHPTQLARPWAVLSLPRAENGATHVVRGPHGFVALASESLSMGKVVAPSNHYLYRSDDGITWQRLPMPAQPSYPGLRSLAYGGGRYVMAGQSGGSSSNDIFTSSDLVTWSHRVTSSTNGGGYHRAKWVNGQFFVLGTFRDFLVSTDGLAWTVVPSVSLLQQQDVDFGNGLFVMVGSGYIRTSRDGRAWDDRAVKCTLPGGCITDPGGGVHQGFHSHVVFAPDASGGHFYVDALSSSDGLDWQAYDGPTALEYVDGYLFGRSGGSAADDRLQAFRPGEPPSLIRLEAAALGPRLSGGTGPETITTPLATGETCVTHRCLIIDDVLYLVR
jgi:hypothetical protein